MKKIKEMLIKDEESFLVYLYIFICSVFLTLTLVYIQFMEADSIIKVFFKNPKLIFYTFCFILFINISIYILSSSLKAMFLIVNIPLIILTLINQQKLLYRNEVLVPADFLQIKEASSMIASSIKIDIINSKNIIMLILFCVLFYISFLLKKKKINLKIRVATLIIVPIMLYSIIFAPVSLIKRWMPLFIYENQVVVYERNGFVLGFANELSNIIMSKPAGYSEDKLLEIESNLSNVSMKMMADNSTIQEKTNIIVILSEAFTDPTKIKGITYSSDPLEPVREIMNTNGHMTLISPQTGGGTANVEYEVLTGVSMSLYSESAIAYQQYINKQHMSLASYLTDYKSIGIHPFSGWFWRRDKVYPLLGFDEFYSVETMNNTELKGGFVSDSSLTKEIIEKYESNPNDSLFVSAVSMQNHAAYEYNRYGNENVIKVIGNEVASEALIPQLEEYATGVYYAASALKELITYFESVNEPTYIIMYGDHTPSFGQLNDEYYSLLGYKDADGNVLTPDVSEYLYRETPIIFWSNREKEYIEPDYISPFFLSKEILKYSNIPLTGYYEYLDKANENIKALSRNTLIDNNGIQLVNETNTEEIRKLNLIAYDINFGNNYLKLK